LRPLEQRLPPKTLETVMSMLVSVQWDRWRFMLPAKPLLKLNVAVVSHGHQDHWHRNFRAKDAVVVPLQVPLPYAFTDLRNVVYTEGAVSFGALKLRKLGRRELSLLLKRNIETPHAFWWLAEANGCGVLFVGDMNANDAEIVSRLMAVAHQQFSPIRAVLLPSFGGVEGHGGKAMEVSIRIGELALELADAYNLLLGAMPHPVNADWADFNAVPAQ